jgi:hypothetical protein
MMMNYWQTKYAKVMCDIFLNGGDSHIAMIKHLETSKEVWDYFQSLYQLTNRATQMVLKKMFNT